MPAPREALMQVMLMEQSPVLLQFLGKMPVAWGPLGRAPGHLEEQQWGWGCAVPPPLSLRPQVLPKEGVSPPSTWRVAYGTAWSLFSQFALTENANPGGFVSQDRYLILLIGDFQKLIHAPFSHGDTSLLATEAKHRTLLRHFGSGSWQLNL